MSHKKHHYMKKQLLLMLLALPLIGYFACRKSDHQIPVEQIKDPFAREAAQFLEKQLSAEDYASLDFIDYSLMKKSDTEAVGVRFNVKGTKGKKFAVVGKTDKGLIGNWVDVSAMSSESLAQGVLKTSTFSGEQSREVSFVKNKVVKIMTIENKKTVVRSVRYNAKGEQMINTQMSGIVGPDNQDPEDWVWLPTVVVTGYKTNYYSPTFYSLYYYFNQAPSYLYTYSTLDPYASGGGGGYTVEVPPFSFQSDAAVDIERLINCFNQVNSTNATYEIKICADLPDNNAPGYLYNLEFEPGHAFVTLTKRNGAHVVSQSIGFYPVNGKKSIMNEPVTSKIVNDMNHQYNASMTKEINVAGFDAAITMARSLSTNAYDLNDFNCTNFAVQVWNVGTYPGIYLEFPDWYGSNGISQPGQPDVNYGMTPNGLYKELNLMHGTNSSVSIGTFVATGTPGTGCQ